ASWRWRSSAHAISRCCLTPTSTEPERLALPRNGASCTMHRALAAWLIARPSRAAFACALCSALAALLALPLVVAASAIPVLVLLHHGLGPAFGIALAGAVAATLVWLSSALPSMWMAVLLLLSCCVLFGSLALAAVL